MLPKTATTSQPRSDTLTQHVPRGVDPFLPFWLCSILSLPNGAISEIHSFPLLLRASTSRKHVGLQEACWNDLISPSFAPLLLTLESLRLFLELNLFGKPLRPTFPIRETRGLADPPALLNCWPMALRQAVLSRATCKSSLLLAVTFLLDGALPPIRSWFRFWLCSL